MTIDELYKYLKLITPAGCSVIKEPFSCISDNNTFNTFNTECIHVCHVEPKDKWYVTLTNLCFLKTKRGALIIYLQATRLPEWLTTAFKLRPKPNNERIFYVTPKF